MNSHSWFVARLALLIMLLAFLGVPPAAGTSAHQTGERCFPETGQCISGSIQTYWEANGGLPVFGYPISAPETITVEDWTGPAQWFERDRLEDHSAEGLGVLSGRLGADLLERQRRPWDTFPTVSGAPPGCQFFPETRHSLCDPFLSYWRQNGGLARFGFPITERFDETIGDWTGTVQYFERRRMEWHLDLAPASMVQLGLLGRAIYQGYAPISPPQEANGCYVLAPPLRAMAVAYEPLLGCPVFASRELLTNQPPGPRPVPLAYQSFEGGKMVWFNMLGAATGSFGTILVLRYDAARDGLVFQQFQDTWQEGEPLAIDDPPPGLFKPERGFGKLWSENQSVREQLGWATAPERGDDGYYKQFARGDMLLRTATDRVYIIRENGVIDDVPRIPDDVVCMADCRAWR